MIHAWPAVVLATCLIGIGAYGVLARRNAVLVLIGVELILNGANVLFVASGATVSVPSTAGSVLPLFIITIAAAEVVVALAVVLLAFRASGIDVTEKS